MACDFLQVYDMWFRPLPAFFVINIKSREVIRVGVTRALTQQWTAQQIRNITPFGEGPDVIIRDNDNKFTAPAALLATRGPWPSVYSSTSWTRALRVGNEFDRVAKGAGMKGVRTAVQAPLINARCERFLGSVRRECLDHVIILAPGHLANVLRIHIQDHFCRARPHQVIG